MNRDSFYRQILERLDATLDPDAFERAACDLLRPAYPGLSIVSGGSDSGMDGAIGDGAGEPFPLVSTTGNDALDNLTRNLRKHIEDGYRRRKAVFATSKALSPQRKRNLYNRARELGFELINIHDQPDMALRLYRSPEWCRELLGLVGDPPPLSLVPRSVRPYYNQEVVGRDEVLAWLRALTGDALLVGQPGAGKTYLLQHLVIAEDYGLFVVSRDRTQIAEGLRQHQPHTLILDDAHNEQELLRDLIQLRREFGASFRILATSWPGPAERIGEILSVAGSARKELDLLSRNEIVEVIHGTGLSRPTGLVAELVNQAEGRAGLAVTLTHLLRLDPAGVFSGDALARQIAGPVEAHRGSKTQQILAAHAVGGEVGLPMQVTAQALSLNLLEVREILTLLAAGGVLYERGENVSVRPPALRDALVKDVFFAGALSLPQETLMELLKHANGPAAAKTLYGTYARGGQVPLTLLADLANSTGDWSGFARTGAEAVRWILTHHPELVLEIAEEALHFEPAAVLPLLLTKAIGDDHPLHSHLHHPLRFIQNWVQGTTDENEAVLRRTQLHHAATAWQQTGGDAATYIKCVPLTFDPEFDFGETDPGAGMTIQIYRGTFSKHAYDKIFELWPAVMNFLTIDEPPTWRPLIEATEVWYFARIMTHSIEISEHLRIKGSNMVQSLAAGAAHHPGVIQQLHRNTLLAGEDLALPVDPTFDTLFPRIPNRSEPDFKRITALHLSRVKKLAAEWAILRPNELTKRLDFIASERTLAGLGEPDYLFHLCLEVATVMPNPELVAKNLIENGPANNLVHPFLNQAVIRTTGDWDMVLGQALSSPNFTSAGILVTLRNQNVSANKVAAALAAIPNSPELANQIAWDRATPDRHLIALLDHEDEAVAGEALRGVIHRSQTETLPDEVAASLETAFLKHARNPADDWLVQQTVTDKPQLAEDWLRSRLQDRSPRFFNIDRAIAVAVEQLSWEQRRELLFMVPDTVGSDDVIRLLLKEDDELYKATLESSDLRHLHLAPFISTHPDPSWERKALLALARGYATSDIARAMRGGMRQWQGNESIYWKNQMDSIAPLMNSDSFPLREVAQLVLAAYQANKERAEKTEREEAIYGLR